MRRLWQNPDAGCYANNVNIKPRAARVVWQSKSRFGAKNALSKIVVRQMRTTIAGNARIFRAAF
jgi:hypothetical protein